MKCIVRDLNDPSKAQLWDVQGFLPENFICVAPDAVEKIEDCDVDLVAKTATINVSKKSDRISSELSAKSAIDTKKSERAVKIAELKSKYIGKKLTAPDVLPALEALLSALVD